MPDNLQEIVFQVKLFPSCFKRQTLLVSLALTLLHYYAHSFGTFDTINYSILFSSLHDDVGLVVLHVAGLEPGPERVDVVLDAALPVQPLLLLGQVREHHRLPALRLVDVLGRLGPVSAELQLA